MYVKKITSFCQVLKDAHKKKLVSFFCLTMCIHLERFDSNNRDRQVTCNIGMILEILQDRPTGG